MAELVSETKELTFEEIQSLERDARLIHLIADLKEMYGSVDAFLELKKLEQENINKLADYFAEMENN